MKFCTLRQGGRGFVALLDPDAARFWRVEDLIGRPVPDMAALIRGYDQLPNRLATSGLGEPLAEAVFQAPLRPPRSLMCVGKNYRAHAHEFTASGFDSSARDASDAVPEAPIIFTKMPETVIATGEAIRHPGGLSDSLDYEAELAVVIGRAGRGIRAADAMDHVFGYTIVNDVTARDLQARHKQWFIGKSLDTFCPMGPWLATADEIDLATAEIRCWVNGELRQHGHTADLIFDVPTLIETLSAGMTLLPGDVIATGTPAGVGVGFEPPRFLRPGDEVAIEITGLGRLVNQVA